MYTDRHTDTQTDRHTDRHEYSIVAGENRNYKESHEQGFKWHFDKVHKEAFKKIKDAMTSAPVLRYYSLDEPVVISCDPSQFGLGCVLLQNYASVAYGSKALTDAEYAYAQIEKELLAIVFAIKKFHSYIFGRSDVTVEIDLLPLVHILEKPLYQVPLRLQKLDFKLVAKRYRNPCHRCTKQSIYQGFRSKAEHLHCFIRINSKFEVIKPSKYYRNQRENSS